MDKIWAAELLDKYDGYVNIKVRLFDSKEKAIKCMNDWKNENCRLIEDVKSLIDDGNEDCILDEEQETYFYCYNSFSFDEMTINIQQMEVE